MTSCSNVNPPPPTGNPPPPTGTISYSWQNPPPTVTFANAARGKALNNPFNLIKPF